MFCYCGVVVLHSISLIVFKLSIPLFFSNPTGTRFEVI